MATMLRLVLILVMLSLVGGVIMLGVWNAPPPTAKIEKVIPNDRFFTR